MRGSTAAPGAPFTIEIPVLSRGEALRDDIARTPADIAAGWSTALTVAVGTDGAVAVEHGRPAWRPSVGDGPQESAVLVGAVDGVDHWALSVPGTVGCTLRELGDQLDDDDAGLVTTAVALLAWHHRGGFCPTCGEPSGVQPAGWSRICPNGHQEFPRTDPAVIVLVHDGADRMVLARQSVWAPGRYSVLAGFTEAGESLEGTVHREIREEIGLEVNDIRYLGSQPWPFPRSLMIGFAARAVDPDAPFAPQDGEIEEARWVHRDVVRKVLEKSGWDGQAPEDPRPEFDPDDASAEHHGIDLPGSISIARRMIEGWAGLAPVSASRQGVRIEERNDEGVQKRGSERPLEASPSDTVDG